MQTKYLKNVLTIFMNIMNYFRWNKSVLIYWLSDISFLSFTHLSLLNNLFHLHVWWCWYVQVASKKNVRCPSWIYLVVSLSMVYLCFLSLSSMLVGLDMTDINKSQVQMELKIPHDDNLREMKLELLCRYSTPVIKDVKGSGSSNNFFTIKLVLVYELGFS